VVHRHDITEILLKVTLHTITLIPHLWSVLRISFVFESSHTTVAPVGWVSSAAEKLDDPISILWDTTGIIKIIY